MLTYTPFISVILIILITRTVITALAPNWITAWIILEINILRFIPIILQSKSNQETEAAIKYFLSQALGSILLLIGSSIILRALVNKRLAIIILITSLLLKLGAAPCHLWFPSVITSLSWINCFLLSTWQKIAPLILLSFSYISRSLPKHTILTAITGTTIGGIIGINQTNLRTILAYSSVSHLGWIIILSSSPRICITYLILYITTVTPIFIIMIFSNIKSTTQININQKIKQTYLILLVLLCSLAGIPPLTGFLPKLLAISTLIRTHYIVILIILVGSFINLYFYLNVAFRANIQSIFSTSNKSSKTTTATTIILSTSILGILPILTCAMTYIY